MQTFRAGITILVVGLIFSGCESCDSKSSGENESNTEHNVTLDSNVVAPPCLGHENPGTPPQSPADQPQREDPIFVSCRQNDLCVTMHWRTPGDETKCDDCHADVDLKYLNRSEGGWNKSGAVASNDNKLPDWSNSDGRTLKSNDYQESEAETLSQDGPQNGVFDVGIHYQRATTQGFCDYKEYESTDVTVQVFLESRLVAQFERVFKEQDQFWQLGTIRWENENPTFEGKDKLKSSFPP